MSTIASRDLRNHTSEVLGRVTEGERVTVTVNGRPVAEIGPVSNSRPIAFTRSGLVTLLTHKQADAGLAAQLEELAGDTTDDLADL